MLAYFGGVVEAGAPGAAEGEGMTAPDAWAAVAPPPIDGGLTLVALGVVAGAASGVARTSAPALLTAEVLDAAPV